MKKNAQKLVELNNLLNIMDGLGDKNILSSFMSCVLSSCGCHMLDLIKEDIKNNLDSTGQYFKWNEELKQKWHQNIMSELHTLSNQIIHN